VSDPLALAALGGAAAGEAIKFLFQQASEVLKTWRSRREKASERLPVPIVDNNVLDGPITDATVDVGAVEQRQKDAVALIGALAPYAMDAADIDPSDPELAAIAGQLRALLESVYGAHLTFRGEQRSATGSAITVSQRVQQVDGAVIGVDATNIGPGAGIAVGQHVDDVSAGGSVTGVQADRIG